MLAFPALIAVFIRLIACLVAASCTLLTVLQTEQNRTSWFFAGMTGTVTVNSFFALVFRYIVDSTGEVNYPTFLAGTYIAVVMQLALFAFSMEYLHAWTLRRKQFAYFFAFLLIVTLPLFSQALVPGSLIVRADNTIDYQFATWMDGFYALVAITDGLILLSLYRDYRKNSANFVQTRLSLTIGVSLIMLSAMSTSVPFLRHYSPEQICYFLGCVFLARPVLKRHLFNPLAEFGRLIEHRALLLSAVTGTGQRIAASLNLKLLLEITCAEVCNAFSCDRVCLYLKDEEDLKLRAVTESPEASQTTAQLDSSGVEASQPASVTQALNTANVAWNASHAEMSIPLLRAGKTIGVLSLQSAVPNRFPADDLEVFQLLAQQIVIAIDNARLFEEVEAARQVAAAASAAKTSFLSMMSHDLRTPLHTIVLTSELLVKSSRSPDISLPDGVRDDMAKIAENADYMSRLVNNILDFSRIEAGKVELRCQPLDPLLVLDPVRQQGLKLARPGVTLETTYHSDLPLIFADNIKLEEILMNLVTNACKFCHAGTVRIDAEVLANEAALCFSVVDTGPGIPPELQPTLFDRFSQARHVARQYGGTGLGLSICKSLVELHHGRIWFESEIGRGASFFFTIPLASPEQIALQSTPSHEPSVTRYFNRLPSILPSQAVLLVSEAEDEVATMRTLLDAEGYQVIQFAATDCAPIAEMVPLLEPDLTVAMCTGYSELTASLRQILPKRCVVLDPPGDRLSPEGLRNILVNVETF